MREALQQLPREIGGAYRYSDRWFGAFIERVFRGHVTTGEALGSLATELIQTFSDSSTYTLFPDVSPLLARAQGMRVGVVSNWGPRLSTLLGGLGVEADLALTSALERLEKPDPALFQRALTGLGVTAGEALHVGDRLDTDVLGARAAGIRPVLLDRSGRMSTPPGLRVVRSLEDLELT